MMPLINKLARVYAHKYDLRKYGYEFDDIRSIASEIYVSALPKFKGLNNCKIETYLSRCLSNALLNIVRDEMRKPLNHSISLDDTIDDTQRYMIDEWLRVRDILLQFNGMQRLIIKEILDPSNHVITVMKNIIDKHNSKNLNVRSIVSRRLNINTLVFAAIRLVYAIDENSFKNHMDGIKKRIKSVNCNVDLY